MSFYEKMEKKLGKYAIKNLTLILICCYIGGYIIQRVSPEAMMYLTLDPYKIIHGQVWRILSWILIPPPESNMFFAVMMLLFYYSIGTVLEKTWGSFQYNLYIFSGMLFTLIGSFLLMLYYELRYDGGMLTSSTGVVSLYTTEMMSTIVSVLFSTYYVNMSIFLAFASTFPEHVVLFMFIIPVKVKVLGFVYGGFLIYEMVDGILSNPGLGFVYPFVIGSSLLNFIVFFFTSRKHVIGKFKKTHAQKAYNAQMKDFDKFKKAQSEAQNSTITKHKCAICGRTEKDGEDLVFRFCSKCEGNYEYCQDHLYTHIHFTNKSE